MEKVEISHRTIIFAILFLIGLWFIYKVIAVIVLFFVAFVLMTALNPLVDRMQRWRLPRPLGIFIAYILVIGIVSFVIGSVIPPLIEQSSVLAKDLALPLPDMSLFQLDVNTINNQLEALSRNFVGALHIVLGAASNILAIFTIGVMTFYLLMERANLKNYLKLVFIDHDSEERAEQLIDNIEKKLGGWVRGQIALMFIVGIMCYLGLRILGVSFALPLAMVAGLLEFIPNIGPTLSAVPAILVGLSISPALALGVLFLYIAVQQLENNIIVPQVMRHAAGIHPLVTIIALMVGFTLGGVGGAVLAVPMYLVIEVVIKDIYNHRKS
ncbi:hypothetical protein A2160_00180 [Candidatus Beckwithbacteria bacterium RBG_13_42_9]|uniref:AI-2E family transporter n=1 Tax=Candidatus Beckwithbacteria bacterium RBG_13_42_9 TaxID=1797457 RepID=A0A1F5E536_9BACT|nr:MAG: hypothetical protein A2160_00180 [Candidatus Beckwithbacteria bacterium RBG_13_42_9]